MSVVQLRQQQTLDEAVREIHRQFAEEQSSKKKAYRHRLRAGEMLLALRKRIEAGEAGVNMSWWDWYESKFVRSRRDAEKVMALAQADDPEAALENERAANRERMANKRAAHKAVVCRSNDDASQDREPERAPPRPLAGPGHSAEWILDKLRFVVMHARHLPKQEVIAMLGKVTKEVQEKW